MRMVSSTYISHTYIIYIYILYIYIYILYIYILYIYTYYILQDPTELWKKENVSIYRRRLSMIEKLRTFFFFP